MLFPNRESGFILVTTMLFLLVLNLLAFSALEVGLLESKMSSFYRDKVESFYKAENKLLQLEGELGGDQELDNIKVIDTNICGVTFYRLSVNSKYRSAKTCLEAIFAKIDETKICDPKLDKSIAGRQSFLIKYCQSKY
jgi:hypothetical protein